MTQNQINNRRETIDASASMGDGPLRWVGSSRWKFDRGAIAGEPFAFLDGDNETSVIAMVEIQTPGKPACYEVRKVGGILLSRADFPAAAAMIAEHRIAIERKMSNYTAGQNHEPLEHEMAEYVELEVTLRSKTTFGTDKETIRVWDGQSAKDVAERTAQGYGAEVVEIRNPDGSIYEEALKVEDSPSPGM